MEGDESCNATDRFVAPAVLYKYVAADRVDVLENASIRFTPPLNTNDIFEVRQTFDLIAGPKFEAEFERNLAEINIDDAIVGALENTPLAGLPPDVVRRLFPFVPQENFEQALRGRMREAFAGVVVPKMNSQKSIDYFLSSLGGNLIGLSLAERMDSPPMWAHYSGNSSGFVIAFDTENSFFRRGDLGERQGLQRISYFDGRIPEILEDPYVALCSKQADWAYEREWRLYLKSEQAEEVFKIGADVVHLVQFPREAVMGVILGLNASSELEGNIREIMNLYYPHGKLSKIEANRLTSLLLEKPLR